MAGTRAGIQEKKERTGKGGRPGSAGNRSGAGAVRIRMHVAADSGGKVVWPEVHVGQVEIECLEDLKKLLGEGAGIAWSLRTWAGSATQLSPDDPRIEQGGFLLRLDSTAIRSGMKAECAVVA